MPGISGIITGPAHVFYHTTPGTDFPAWPSALGDVPSGFSVMGAVSSDGVTVGRDWATTYDYVLSYAEPIAEILNTALTTLEFELAVNEADTWEVITGNAESSNVLDMSVGVGPLTEYTVILMYGNAGGRQRGLYIPRATVKPVGDTVFGGGVIARVPVMITALYDADSATALELHSES